MSPEREEDSPFEILFLENSVEFNYFSVIFSPKSPPNTPNPELASSLEEELKAVYINHLNKPDNENDGFSASDIIWDWSSQPNIPCK